MSACAGGTAFGSTCGALFNLSLGWRGELWCLACANALVLGIVFYWRHLLPEAPSADGRPDWSWAGLGGIFAAYGELLVMPRARRTYLYVFCNGLFHYGIYAWLSTYLTERYRLDDRGIGWALLGYGVMGMLFGPAIGRFADRYGRARLIPAAFGLAAVCAAVLALPVPLYVAAVAITLLSFGYDLAYSPLVGIVTALAPERRGLAFGINTLMLFCGFGAGTVVFAQVMVLGLAAALSCFAVFQLALAIAALRLFEHE